MPKSSTVVVLLGHGSRLPEANAGLNEVAQQVAARLGGVPVVVAFLQLAEPGLERALEDCVERGYRDIVVVPFFLFAGAHVREDIPAILAQFTARHGEVRVRAADVLGGHPKLAEAAAQRAEEMF